MYLTLYLGEIESKAATETYLWIMGGLPSWMMVKKGFLENRYMFGN